MGGAKKKPIGTGAKNKNSSTASGFNQVQAQPQKKEESKKSSGGGKQKSSVAIDESAGKKALQNMKAITAQALARTLAVKISVANSFLRSMETRGLVKQAGGYSGHRVYQPEGQ